MKIAHPTLLLITLIGSCPSITSAQLTIVRNFTGGTPPSNLVGGGDLPSIFHAAADTWEGLILHPAHTVRIDFGWAPITGTHAAEHVLLQQGGSPNRETHGRILFDNDGSNVLFADTTPRLHGEFQQIHQSSLDLGGCEVDVEHRHGPALPSSPAAMGADLYMLALHEIAHALGVALDNRSYQNEVWNGSIDVVQPLPFPGTSIPVGTTAHVSLMGPLLVATLPVAGFRVLPSDVDILAVAQVGGYDRVQLRRFGARTVIRNGSGVNPVLFTELSRPVVGTNWTTSVGQIGHLMSGVFFGYGGPGTFATPFGELLCTPPLDWLHVSGFPTHVIPIPHDCTLIGARLSTQGISFLSQLPFHFPPRFTNALDIEFGAH